MQVFARNYRGFKRIDVDTDIVNILVGDNSCGKTSIIYLVESVLRSDLTTAPRFDSDLAVDDFDYFSPYFDYADVTFGITDSKNKNFSKVITVSRSES